MIVNGQNCVDKVGSLAHDDIRVIADHTFIFTDSEYTVACERTVIAWEFCHGAKDNATSITFHPGIWMPVEADNNDSTKYTLVKSNTITFAVDQDSDNNNDWSCWTFNLPEADQFIAPPGSVVGLYSNITRLQSGLLRTNRSMAPTSFRFSGNHSVVNTTIGIQTRYHIALRVHLGKSVKLGSALFYLANYLYIQLTA